MMQSKLVGSKWTAVTPTDGEKHFVMTSVDYRRNGTVANCCLEAILTKRKQLVDWGSLKQDSIWQTGWR